MQNFLVALQTVSTPTIMGLMLLGVIVVALLVIAAVFYASGKKKPNDKSAN